MGVDRKEIAVECAGRTLVVRGIRRARAEGGYSDAEITCGPFVRSFENPFPVSGEPAVHLTRGILRIRLRSSGETQQKEVTPQ